RTLGERHAEASMRAVMRGPEQAALGAGDEELDETLLDLEIHARRLPADELLTDLPVRRPPQLGACFAEDVDTVARCARVTRHGAVGPREQSDHPHHRCRIDSACRTLIVERQVATRNRILVCADLYRHATVRIE